MKPYESYFEEIESYLISKEPDMFMFLEEIVKIQSGSHNKAGIDRTAMAISHAFQGIDVSTEIVEQQLQGNNLVIRSSAQPSANKQVLLVGHMDTVFPEDTDFNWYKVDNDKSYGPGVVDMKGGLVVGIYALKALAELGLLGQIPITFIFNSDEEIGSRSSVDLIQKEANSSAFAFVLEAGGLENEVVTGRKGNLTIELHIEGKAGHAAFATKDKPSAILEMAHKIIEFESLNDFGRGITINVGKIDGGIGSNTIPEFSNAQVDFRFVDPSDLKKLEEKVSDIANKVVVQGTQCSVDFISGRPPMQQSSGNRRLFQTTADIAKNMGYPVKEQFRFGVSDANFIADLNVPVIDGLGPIGARDHSRDEYMIKESLLKRTILLSCSIIECWNRSDSI
ncbi:MAG: M20 family metallopeptidase [Desulfobacterales bacterium]|nr:M20 family metallopeptidase [Desulfobacterales bacterium]MDX2512624.1 M20 family metallopeptidase [Desulfobacterales bacterium]